jgi:hypothetical protein
VRAERTGSFTPLYLPRLSDITANLKFCAVMAEVRTKNVNKRNNIEFFLYLISSNSVCGNDIYSAPSGVTIISSSIVTTPLPST